MLEKNCSLNIQTRLPCHQLLLDTSQLLYWVLLKCYITSEDVVNYRLNCLWIFQQTQISKIHYCSRTWVYICGIEVTLLSKLEDSILPPSSHMGFDKTHSLDLSSPICELGGGIHQLTSEFLSSSSSSSLSRGTCHLLSKTGLWRDKWGTFSNDTGTRGMKWGCPRQVEV